MAKVILRLGAFQFLMQSKSAALDVIKAMVDAKELDYQGHDGAYTPIYRTKEPPKCEIESAGRLQVIPESGSSRSPVPKPQPPLPPRTAARQKSAADLWSERAGTENIVPHSIGQKVNSPRRDDVQEVNLRPVSQRKARAQLALIAGSISAPPANVICLPAPKAQGEFFPEDATR